MAVVQQDDRVPVTVVTGYLGAGKTTLLNHVLAGGQGRRYAVIVNEFGEVGIDGSLIETGAEELIELSSGCICCVVRGDLIRTLRGLLKRDRTLDGIFIETTGLANPSPVIQTFVADQILANLARLDAVVTVVDAVNIGTQLGASTDAADQIALASTIVLNKVQDAGDTGETERQINALNPHAPILRADRGRVDPAEIVNTRGFHLSRVATDLETEEEHGHHHGHDHSHHDHDHDHHDHISADGISSLSLVAQGDLDGGAVESWVQGLLATQGANILRMKGILAIAGESRRVVIQSVNMLFEGDHGQEWGDHPRASRMVFIGRQLDHAALRQGFEACKPAEVV